MITIGILVPSHARMSTPGKRPISAALDVIPKDTLVVFGSDLTNKSNSVHMRGVSVVENNWKSVDVPIFALHDRFPSQRRAAHFKRLIDCASSLVLK